MKIGAARRYDSAFSPAVDTRNSEPGTGTSATLVAGHWEGRKPGRAGWLRAVVLGANDGLVSTSSLLVGVAASGAASSAVLTAGIAGLSAGPLAMAAGEYVYVSSQSDVESADRQTEIAELAAVPEGELEELTQIYQARGVAARARRAGRRRAARGRLAAGSPPRRAGAPRVHQGATTAGRRRVSGQLHHRWPGPFLGMLATSQGRGWC